MIFEGNKQKMCIPTGLHLMKTEGKLSFPADKPVKTIWCSSWIKTTASNFARVIPG